MKLFGINLTSSAFGRLVCASFIFFLCDWISKGTEFLWAEHANGFPVDVPRYIYLKIWVQPDLFLGWEFSPIKWGLFIFPVGLYVLFPAETEQTKSSLWLRVAGFTAALFLFGELYGAMVILHLGGSFVAQWNRWDVDGMRFIVACLCGICSSLGYQRILKPPHLATSAPRGQVI